MSWGGVEGQGSGVKEGGGIEGPVRGQGSALSGRRKAGAEAGVGVEGRWGRRKVGAGWGPVELSYMSTSS